MSSGDVQHAKRILFASYHCYVDPSSGAAVSVRELLTQLRSARQSFFSLPSAIA